MCLPLFQYLGYVALYASLVHKVSLVVVIVLCKYIYHLNAYPLVEINKIYEGKIVNIFLPVLTFVLGAPKNPLIEMVLLSTNKICFGLEIRKIVFDYAL